MIDLPPKFDLWLPPSPAAISRADRAIQKASFLPGMFPVAAAARQGLVPSGTAKVIFLTSGTSWSVPSDWNSSTLGGNPFANKIEVLGAGSGPQNTSSVGEAGGAGGAYSRSDNIVLTPGGSASYAIGTGGPSGSAGGDTWFNATSLANAVSNGSSVSVAAKGSGAAGAGTGATGGQASAGVGTTKYNGGDGGGSGNTSGDGGGGGGGAAGPSGAGGSGVASVDGNGTDGGNGGTANNGATAGGTGGDGSNSGTADPGLPGSAAALWTSNPGGVTAGPGSGGGGGGGRSTGGAGGAGGAPGAYGGGAGGAGDGTSGTPTSPDGADGIIVITYYPLI